MTNTERLNRCTKNDSPPSGECGCLECRLDGAEKRANAYESSIGVTIIARERKRQIEKEQFDLQHDRQHCNGEMAVAAACYAVEGIAGITLENTHSIFNNQRGWPWRPEWDKRAKHHRIRQLAIAGALIAAEIDRLQTD